MRSGAGVLAGGGPVTRPAARGPLAGGSHSYPAQLAGPELGRRLRLVRGCQVPAALRLGIIPRSAADAVDQPAAGGLRPAPSRWHAQFGAPADAGQCEPAGQDAPAWFGPSPGLTPMTGEPRRPAPRIHGPGRLARVAAAWPGGRWES